MTGKKKCKILKEIRRQIAENNDICFVVEECTHKGRCRGTCPKCEAEVRMLERELEKRRAAGQKVVIAGVSAGFLLTSCTPTDTVKELASAVVDSLDGDKQVESATMGDPFPETLAGEPALEIEEGEVVPDDIVESNDAEDCDITTDTEEDELVVAGGLLPVESDEEELVIAGGIRYPEDDDEEQP